MVLSDLIFSLFLITSRSGVMNKNNHSQIIEKLPNFIRHERHGFEYTLINREGNKAWYEARYLNGSELVGYVVAKIRIKSANKLPSGIPLPAREEFPVPSSFGKRGWFYMPKSRSIAQAHYFELLRQNEKKLDVKIGASDQRSFEK